MSGHSKWAQIKRQKGVADVKRGQQFTKIGNAITIAVREGGGVTDPAANFRLRLVIEKARAVNMPKENIERAILKATGKLAGDQMQEAVYEGFAPSGVSVIVEAATDNKQRTASEIKQISEKNGGTLASPGAVSYLFESKGLIVADKGGKLIDEIFLSAADAGAEDVEEAGEEVLIYTKPDKVADVKNILSSSGFVVKSLEIIREPNTTTKIEDKETAEKVLSLVNKFEDLDDVQKVYANFDIPDQFLS